MLEAAAGDDLLVAMGVSNVAAHDPEDAGAEDVAIVGVGALEPSANTDADDCLNHPETALVLDKNFYLGTPPNLRFDKNAGGCALFFEGVSANFTVPQDKKNTFTCTDALNADCVSDLIRQTESAAKLAGDSNACRMFLKIGMHIDCVTHLALTGDKALETADQSQYRAITGQGYDLYFVDSEHHYLANRTQKALSQVLMGIIPVITVLEKDGKAKAELTCLRLVDSVAN
ncbi:hypothetical protein PGQ11_008440 [Apiospora arundinis]|uniref:Uncharacterized protein n=1 Tax=Apiospora arundinis TaxID=335852 RepID=A0ABR2IG60_9PEZI